MDQNLLTSKHLSHPALHYTSSNPLLGWNSQGTWKSLALRLFSVLVSRWWDKLPLDASTGRSEADHRGVWKAYRKIGKLLSLHLIFNWSPYENTAGQPLPRTYQFQLQKKEHLYKSYLKTRLFQELRGLSNHSKPQSQSLFNRRPAEVSSSVCNVHQCPPDPS